MKEKVFSVDLDAVRDEAAKLKARGYRLVTLTCVDVDPDHFELLYHYDLNLDMIHLRVDVPKNRTVPSISPVYLAAFLVENEIQGHFGLMFDDLAINYGQTLYLEENVQTTPFCKYTVASADADGGDR